MLFDILALISLLIVVLFLKKLVNIFPSIPACFIRWKENINLDFSVKLRRDRDQIALTMILPFCLSCHKFGLYTLAFFTDSSENAKLLFTIGIFLGFVTFRTILSFVFRPKKMNKNIYHAAVTSSRTFFIMLTIANIATGALLSFLDVNPQAIRTAMIWLSACTYLIFILRKTQIFCSSGSIFTAFLYLCALEILPTGILIVPAVIF